MGFEKNTSTCFPEATPWLFLASFLHTSNDRPPCQSSILLNIFTTHLKAKSGRNHLESNHWNFSDVVIPYDSIITSGKLWMRNFKLLQAWVIYSKYIIPYLALFMTQTFRITCQRTGSLLHESKSKTQKNDGNIQLRMLPTPPPSRNWEVKVVLGWSPDLKNMKACHPASRKNSQIRLPKSSKCVIRDSHPIWLDFNDSSHFFHFPPARGVISSPNLWKRPGEFRLPGGPAGGWLSSH